jgi:hypothetical protein
MLKSDLKNDIGSLTGRPQYLGPGEAGSDASKSKEGFPGDEDLNRGLGITNW